MSNVFRQNYASAWLIHTQNCFNKLCKWSTHHCTLVNETYVSGDHSTGVWVGGSDNGHVGKWAWFPTGNTPTFMLTFPPLLSFRTCRCVFIGQLQLLRVFRLLFGASFLLLFCLRKIKFQNDFRRKIRLKHLHINTINTWMPEGKVIVSSTWKATKSENRQIKKVRGVPSSSYDKKWLDIFLTGFRKW